MRCLFAKLISDEQELDWFLANVVTPQWHFQHDAGRSFADMVAERSAEFPQYIHHLEAYATRFAETIPGPVTGSHELVAALAAKDVAIYGLSNFGVDAWEQFRPTAPIFDQFSDILISGYERLIKPDPAIYHLALQRFGRRAEQCIFIDDRPDNVAAGEAIGIKGHHFTDAPTLERELTALDLL